MNKRYPIALLILVFLFSPFSTEAVNQENSGLPPGIEQQISITQIPKIPTPGDSVNIKIESFSTDLNKARITWSIGGEVLEQGYGRTNFNTIAPEAGGRTVVNIRMETGSGVINRQVVLAPNDVDILWEANTYTPPFYKGKALHTRQSEIRFVAMPNFVRSNGTTIPASELVYTWEYNGSVIQEISGYGRNVAAMIGDLIARPINMQVTVSSVESDSTARNSVTVVAEEPQTVMYENNPILGLMLERALAGEIMLERDEVEISAIPYYFSTDEINTATLENRWLLNGRDTGIPFSKYSVVFRNTEGEDGVARVSVRTKHTGNLLQESDADFSIILDQSDEELEDFSF